MIELNEMLKEVEYKEVPFINHATISSTLGGFLNQPTDYDKLIKWIKKTPEAIGILNALVTDILSDGYTFNATKKTKGDNKEREAEEFAERNFFKQEFKSVLLDWFMLGDAALWKGKITDSQVKEAIKSVGAVETKELIVSLKQDEDFNRTRVIRHVAWSTMNIRFDEHQITGFTQIVKGKEKQEFTTEEIIHGKFMPLDGKVYGYSPFQAALSSITTLGLMKDYNGRYFEHGGAPDHMFILPKEMAGSPHVKALTQQLETYNHRMRGNLVFTGEVEVKDINAFNKDMEFRLLAIYHTGVLALAVNMPMARLSAILGQEVKSSATGDGLEDAGYWRTISEIQDYWETLLNTQLFEPEFGVKIKFNRSYLQDEVRETQIAMVKTDVIAKGNTELQKYGLKFSEDYIRRYFNVPKEDIIKGELKMMPDTGLARQNQLNNSQVLSEPSKLQKDESKRNEQTGL